MKQFVTVPYDIVDAGGVHSRQEKSQTRQSPSLAACPYLPLQQVLIGVNDSRPTAA